MIMISPSVRVKRTEISLETRALEELGRTVTIVTTEEEKDRSLTYSQLLASSSCCS